MPNRGKVRDIVDGEQALERLAREVRDCGLRFVAREGAHTLRPTGGEASGGGQYGRSRVAWIWAGNRAYQRWADASWGDGSKWWAMVGGEACE